MATLKVSALVAVAASALVCLGIGLARQEPPPAPAVPLLVEAAAQKSEPPAPSAAPAPPAAGPAEGVHRSANFLVSAPTATMARVIAAEAEHHRRALALKWLGKELPPWARRCEIRFTPTPAAAGGATTFTFGTDANNGPALVSANMEIHGDFLLALNANLPHEVTHTVLASYFGRPLPRWADEGLAVLAEDDGEQFNHDVRARELLNAGRGIRVRVLFGLTDFPKDMVVLYAQGHSLARFLAGRPAARGAVLEDLLTVGALFKTPGADGHRRLIAFVRLGMEKNTSESWNHGAKAVYGFDSVDVLEEEWLAWLGTPESAPPRRKPDARPPAKSKPTAPDLIPPAELPIGPRPQ